MTSTGVMPLVVRIEQRRVVGVEHERVVVRLFLAQSEELLDGRAGMGARDPLVAGSPGERRRFRWCGRQGLAGSEQCGDVHAVVDGVRGDGHDLSSRFRASWSRPLRWVPPSSNSNRNVWRRCGQFLTSSRTWGFAHGDGEPGVDATSGPPGRLTAARRSGRSRCRSGAPRSRRSRRRWRTPRVCRDASRSRSRPNEGDTCRRPDSRSARSRT